MQRKKNKAYLKIVWGASPQWIWWRWLRFGGKRAALLYCRQQGEGAVLSLTLFLFFLLLGNDSPWIYGMIVSHGWCKTEFHYSLPFISTALVCVLISYTHQKESMIWKQHICVIWGEKCLIWFKKMDKGLFAVLKSNFVWNILIIRRNTWT